MQSFEYFLVNCFCFFTFSWSCLLQKQNRGGGDNTVKGTKNKVLGTTDPSFQESLLWPLTKHSQNQKNSEHSHHNSPFRSVLTLVAYIFATSFFLESLIISSISRSSSSPLLQLHYVLKLTINLKRKWDSNPPTYISAFKGEGVTACLPLYSTWMVWSKASWSCAFWPRRA